MKNPVTPVKKFVRKHKTAIAVTVAVAATAVVSYKIDEAGLKQHDAFLRENGLYDTFYNLAVTP